MYINDNQGSQRDALLLRQLTANQCHYVQQLSLEHIPVRRQTALPRVSDSHLDLGRPVDL